MAEIEAALRRDDPAFVHLIEHLEIEPPEAIHPLLAPAFPVPQPQPQPRTDDIVIEADPPEPVVETRRRWRTVLAVGLVFVFALGLTGGVTALLGPDAGGLVGVLAIMAATMYAYQTLHGCPGRRR